MKLTINKIIFSIVLFLTVSMTTIAQDDVLFIEESDFSSGEANLQQMFSELSAAAEGASKDRDHKNLPIDGGLSILLAAGVGYGANRLRKNRKNES
jgi:hypothetical protein